MKQQLKRIVAAQITEQQAIVGGLKAEVFYFERLSNKEDPNTAGAFKMLNIQKQALRKAKRKLRKLTILQHEIKSMVAYMTTETQVEVVMKDIVQV